MEFDEDKKRALAKEDKSKKGSWDLRIKDLCDRINCLNDYYTTSSCSGRIVIVKDGEKKPGMILFSSHNKAGLEEIKKFLENEKIWIKMEPCALHICCRNFESAFDLLGKARGCGWKRSGIMSDRKIACELFSTENLAVPVFDRMDYNYLEQVINECNKKLEKTWIKIEKLRKFF